VFRLSIFVKEGKPILNVEYENFAEPKLCPEALAFPMATVHAASSWTAPLPMVAGSTVPLDPHDVFVDHHNVFVFYDDHCPTTTTSSSSTTTTAPTTTTSSSTTTTTVSSTSTTRSPTTTMGPPSGRGGRH